MRNKNVGAASGVRPCGSLIAVLRSAPMWGRLGASSVEELAFMSAKSLKIGASGGAAQAAEAKGGKSLNFALVSHFDSHFGNSTPKYQPDRVFFLTRWSKTNDTT